MSEELQTVEDTNPIEAESVDDVTEAGTGETGSELATDSAEGREEINQESINQAINKQHAKFREEERKRKELEAELEEARKKLEEVEASKPAPVIPPIPDPYDDDFEAKVKARDEALIAKAKHDAAEADKAKAKLNEQRKEEERKKQDIQKSIESYNTKAVELGLDKNEVNKAGQVLVDYGVTADIATFLLQDQDGPLMTQYLAANPAEFDEINRMSPMSAAVAIDKIVRNKALSLKPKPSNAPDPTEVLRSQGSVTKKRGVKGTTYE